MRHPRGRHPTKPAGPTSDICLTVVRCSSFSQRYCRESSLRFNPFENSAGRNRIHPLELNRQETRRTMTEESGLQGQSLPKHTGKEEQDKRINALTSQGGSPELHHGSRGRRRCGKLNGSSQRNSTSCRREKHGKSLMERPTGCHQSLPLNSFIAVFTPLPHISAHVI
jgi:hypothetical protein